MTVALLTASGLVAPAALAQDHADAGAARSPANGASAGRIGSPVLKSISNANSVLSEGVRARLAERAAARHPSEIAAHEPAAGEATPAQPATAPTGAPPQATSEPLRRGIAHQRRVQALTGDGITVLSNRVSEPPAPRLSALRPSAVAETEQATDEQRALADDGSEITETRSLRALSSRRDVPQARERSLGIDWLLWPFVLLLATGAVIGTLWFSKKTQ